MAQANMTTNDDFNLELFIKILKMLTAENDNQVVVAARKANEMLKRNSLDWETFAKGKITIVNDPFASIPTPPSPKAAPPPPPKPAPPPPPTRLRRDSLEVGRWMATIHAARPILDTWEKQRLDTIVIDWQHNSPNMTDADHRWLKQMFDDTEPRPIDPALVQQCFDTCDFASLSTADSQRVNQMQKEWTRRGDNKMCGRDWDHLYSLHRYHATPTKGKGKAKRLI